MADDPTFVYFVGTAGSGKSSLAGAFLEWCRNHGLDAIAVNLDPGADRLPYEADIDVRDWVKTEDLMQSEGLGPNGAQIAASDLIALQIEELRQMVAGFRADYVLVDTPGQIELFVFRESGRHVTQTIAPDRSIIAYLIDPILARHPSSLVSQFLLAVSVHFRLGLPMTHMLSKSDLLGTGDLERILEWTEHPDALRSAVEDEQASMYREMNVEMLQMIDSMGALPRLHPTSASDVAGLDDLYAAIQLQFSAGDDPLADTLDPEQGYDPDA